MTSMKGTECLIISFKLYMVIYIKGKYSLWTIIGLPYKLTSHRLVKRLSYSTLVTENILLWDKSRAVKLGYFYSMPSMLINPIPDK
jgi:hypothetical protein